MKVIKVYPEYFKRDRKKLVQYNIKMVQRRFRFPGEFRDNAYVILKKFWPYLSNTKEDIAAGTISVLTLISMDIRYRTPFQVCQGLGIAQSVVLYQIKNKNIKRLKIPGFRTLHDSTDLIKDLIIQNVNIKEIKKKKKKK